MAFVSGFENDVFISYAHDDNEPDLMDVEWVTELVKLLKRALKQKLGARENLEIFWDGWKLQQNHQLDRLDKEVASTAVFVAICSPSYTTGEWTRREIESFAKVAGIESNRLFAIEYLPLPSGMQHPLALQSHFVKPWHQPISDAGARAPISPKEHTSAYLAHLQDLAEQIKDQLITMAQSGATSSAESATAPADAIEGTGVEGQQMKSVLLGMVGVGQEIQDQREDVRRYLEQYGIKVYPDCEKPYYPFDGAAFVEAVAEDLEKCDLFIQLIGDYPAMRLPPLEHDFATTQLLMAEALERDGFEILQWRAADLDLAQIKDEQHVKLLTGTRVMGNLTLETFKATIVEHATIPIVEEEPAEAAHPEHGESPGDDVPEIFVNADTDDDALIDQIMGKLDDMGVNIYAPMNDDNAERIREELEEYYKTCDAIVVVYGKAEPFWVRSQVSMCNKLEHERKRKPKLKALLMAPPEAKANLRMRLSDWQEIDCRDGLDSETLKTVLAGLKR